MTKLSKEEIQFIDNYLENSEVLFADVRMEMVDHVASQIEIEIKTGDNRGFYEIFKEYMVNNKATLLSNNKQFIKETDKAIIKLLWQQLLSKYIVIVTIIVFLVSYFSLLNIEKNQLLKLIFATPILSVIPFILIYLIAKYIFKAPRFSGIERLGFVYMVFCQIFNLFTTVVRGYLKESTQNNNYIVAVFTTVVIVLLVVLIKTTFKIIKNYKTQYVV